MARRPAARGRRRGRRRQTTWIDRTIEENAVTTVQGIDLLSAWRTSLGIDMNLPGMRVERVLIHQQGSNDVGTATISTSWRVGLIIESATGETEVPDPVAEANARWLWNSRYYVNSTVDVGWRYDGDQHLDITPRRGMRNIGETLWLMLSPELAGTTSLAYAAHVRVLVALP